MKNSPIPPGQQARKTFPRFGLSQYANRFPHTTDQISIQIAGDLTEFTIGEELKSLASTHQNSDFHCVTTWTMQGLHWEGIRFKDFFVQLIEPKTDPDNPIHFVVLKGQDGYKTSLLLEDLLTTDVMLAHSLNGEPLDIAHGAPIRLVAPQHYGYKNLKHLHRLEFYASPIKVKQGFLSFMDHPRARVAHEERAVGGPGWFFRYLYRPLIKSTVKEFQKALDYYNSSSES